MLLLSTRATAQTITIAHDDDLRDNTYETLQVTLQNPLASSPISVSLQDARGGPSMSRIISAGNTRRVLFPLPLVQLADLTPGLWPIRITQHTDGTPDQSTLIQVSHPTGSSSTGTLRLAIRQDFNPDPALLTALSSSPVVFVRVTQDELLHDAPLVFACCDAVWLDEQTAAQLSANRALELIAAGPKLLYHGPSAPGSLLASLFWEPAGGSAQLWQLPSAPLPRLHPVEPLLQKLPRLTPQVPPVLRQAGFAAIPLCIALVLLLRVFTARPGILLSVTAGLFILVTAVTLAVMQHSLQPQEQSMTWTTRAVPGALAMTQTLQLQTTLYPQAVQFKNAGLPLLPLAAGAPEWFHITHAAIALEGLSSQTIVPIPSRHQRYFYTRTVDSTPHLDSPPQNAQDFAAWGTQTFGAAWNRGTLITAGQVTPASIPLQPPLPFTQWLPLQPSAIQPTLHAWYELAFQPDHIYHLTVPKSPGPNIAILDFSQLPTSSQ